MKARTLALGVLALGLCVASVPAIAHHAFSAEFDRNQPVKLTGTVTKVEWQNPHVWFYLDVTNEDGTVENWGFEMGPPHLLQGRGWTRSTMTIGDELTVNATRARDGSNRANASNVVLTETGQELGAASSQQLTP